jgi:hypothetical protein
MTNATPFALALACAGIAIPVIAQTQTTGPSEEKLRQVIVYGTEPCPPSPDGEIVICARRPETERYRVPEVLRETDTGPEGESWASRAQSLEFVSETGTQSCSTVGPGGHTGCLEQLIRQARAERRAGAAAAADVP